jgi:hypothetical protein
MGWQLTIEMMFGLTAGLVLFFVIIMLVVKATGGYAPGWQIRCTKCGRTRDAGKAGLVRLKATSVGKRTLGWCSGCGGLRIIAIERDGSSRV